MLNRVCFLFVFLFMWLFAQVPLGLAKEPSFYEEFDQQEELSKQEEKKNTEMPLEFSLVPPAENAAETQGSKQDRGEGKFQGELPKETDFFLTDEKHAHFLQENEQYALADAMLNQTWQLLTKQMKKKEYRKLWQDHKAWLDEGRNTVADSFKKQVPTIPEYHAFMLATVAKTQELAQSIWHEPMLGRYVKDNVFVTLVKEENTIFLQGYGNIPVLTKNLETAREEKYTAKLQAEHLQEKNANDTENAVQADIKKEDTEEKHILKEMPQLLFRAELPKEGKLWLALTTVNGQKLYLLTTQNSLCLVHATNAFPLDFNGVFVKK